MRRSSRLATRGVPRDLLAISFAPSSSISTCITSAVRWTICSRSAGGEKFGTPSYPQRGGGGGGGDMGRGGGAALEAILSCPLDVIRPCRLLECETRLRR